jgi:hypothetical protein
MKYTVQELKDRLAKFIQSISEELCCKSEEELRCAYNYQLSLNCCEVVGTGDPHAKK